MNLFQKNIFSVVILWGVYFLYPSGVWASSYSTAVLADSPVAYWQLAETVGTTATDSSGSGSNGVYTDGPVLNEAGAPLVGMDGKAVKFDGTNDHIKLTLPSNVKSSSITIEAWVKATSFSGSPFIVMAEPRGANALGLGAGLYLGGGGTTNFLKGSGDGSWEGVGGLTTFATNTWNHIAATYDGTTMKVYVNGALDNSLANAQGINWTDMGAANYPDPAQLYIGAFKDNALPPGATVPNLQFFNGYIDEVTIYASALTATKIQDHFNSVSATKKVFGGGTSVVNGGEVTFTAVTGAGEINITTPSPSASVLANLKAENWNLVSGTYYEFVSTATHPDGKRNFTYKLNNADLNGLPPKLAHFHNDGTTFHIIEGSYNSETGLLVADEHNDGFSGYGVVVNPEPATLLLLGSALLGLLPLRKKFLK